MNRTYTYMSLHRACWVVAESISSSPELHLPGHLLVQSTYAVTSLWFPPSDLPRLFSIGHYHDPHHYYMSLKVRPSVVLILPFLYYIFLGLDLSGGVSSPTFYGYFIVALVLRCFISKRQGSPSHAICFVHMYISITYLNSQSRTIFALICT